jgi:glyoxylase-like metal-dependent hydrolase (beta-lactamase superfamily II)
MRDSVPQIAPDELARRLDQGEALQVLDVRTPDRVAGGHIDLGRGLEFRALPNSKLFALPALDALGVTAARPIAVVCGHGNSSKQTVAFLRARGLDAVSVTGGMAAWEAVYVPRTLAPTRTIEHVVQLDRVGKGALGYVLASRGDAFVVDPGRHLDRIDALLAALRIRPVGVVDTHAHADYVSGARDAAARWSVPYYLHEDDARSPYDGTPGRLTYQALRDGGTLRFGAAALRVVHTPGHTLGSVSLLSDDGLALTGDFVFVQAIGRPDLGGQADAWARLLWSSLERARREWPGDAVVLPAHYAGETERRADRAVAARWDVVTATNAPVAIQNEATFLQWVADHTRPPPAAYRTIKLTNLGLATPSLREVEELEAGPNVCAVGP